MKGIGSISEIKECAQMLDTAVIQWMNSGPPDSIQTKLTEARELLQRGVELADAPLRIALVGEFNSGKTLLLNSLLDSTDLFPCLLQPTTGNVLEVRVNLRKEERPPEIRSATISFFNQFEIESILEYYLKDLRIQGIEGLPAKANIGDVEKLEMLLCKKFQEQKSVTLKYSIVSALEYVMALKYNKELVLREERHSCPLPIDLIATSLTLTGRVDLGKGIDAITGRLKQLFEGAKIQHPVEKVTSGNLRALFPMVRRVAVDVSAWYAPFGINPDDDFNVIAFLDFPGLGAEGSNSRDKYLCMSEIRDAHAVLIIFNGSNPGAAGASVMATLFQREGKLTSERTIVAVNRFDEFHPMPSGRTVETYYSNIEQGTTVGFCNILLPAKNITEGGSDFKVYICSALCYLFEEKAERPNWNFGNTRWFNDSKRQAAYTLYKRSQEEFKSLINQVGRGSGVLPEHKQMKAGLERYLVKGGIPPLREDLVGFATQRGEKLIKDDSLKEVRNAVRILDEIAPEEVETEGQKSINPESSFAAQEFYRVLELTVADTLPSGPSEYKRLRIKATEKDLSLWELIEQEIAANIASWPEWFAILNQGIQKQTSRPTSQPRKKFGRYKNLKKQGGTVPTEFRAFDERFRNGAEVLTKYTLECISKAILYSLQRFENHPDYQDSIQHLQSMIFVDKLGNIEEALPLLDVWQPSELAEEEIIPTILERINDEVEAIETLSYPYDGTKPCNWNLALVIRVQVQLMKTYRDRLSRLVAAAESQFQGFFCNEILRAEILPLVRSVLNNPEFLAEVAIAGDGGATWEYMGQVVRAAVNDFKERDNSKKKYFPKPNFNKQAAEPEEEMEEEHPPVQEVETGEDIEEESVEDEEFEEW